MTQPSSSSLPPRVDLRHLFLAVQDQSARQTCLAFATTAAHEIARLSAAVGLEDLAEEVLHWGCKQVDQDFAPGTTFPSASTALTRWGQPPEHFWPYDPARVDTDHSYQPPPAAIVAQVCHFARLRRITASEAAIKSTLAGGQPVKLGIQMSLPLLQTTDGFIAVPTPAEMLAEGHAMLVVGYDDGAAGQGHYIVRNSWGAGWGDAGYGYLPYEYLVRYGGEVWLIA